MDIIRVTQLFVSMYSEGFKNMKPLGKKLWLIIGIKVVIFFVIMKILFFPNFLKTNFDNDRDRADHVITNLTQGDN